MGNFTRTVFASLLLISSCGVFAQSERMLSGAGSVAPESNNMQAAQSSTQLNGMQGQSMAPGTVSRSGNRHEIGKLTISSENRVQGNVNALSKSSVSIGNTDLGSEINNSITGPVVGNIAGPISESITGPVPVNMTSPTSGGIPEQAKGDASQGNDSVADKLQKACSSNSNSSNSSNCHALSMARLSQCAYPKKANECSPGPFEKVDHLVLAGKLGISEREMDKMMRDDGLLGNGFHAEVYLNETTGEYVLTFEGSGAWDYVTHNIPSNGLGLLSQHGNARVLAQKLHSVLGDDLSCTGHSLGGGLCAASSLGTGMEGTTFNAAGLSVAAGYGMTDHWARAIDPRTYVNNAADLLGFTDMPEKQSVGEYRYNLENADQLVTNYHMDYEFLTNAQEFTPLSDSIGKQVSLSVPVDRRPELIDLLVEGLNVATKPFEYHGIIVSIESLESEILSTQL